MKQKNQQLYDDVCQEINNLWGYFYEINTDKCDVLKQLKNIFSDKIRTKYGLNHDPIRQSWIDRK